MHAIEHKNNGAIDSLLAKKNKKNEYNVNLCHIPSGRYLTVPSYFDKNIIASDIQKKLFTYGLQNLSNLKDFGRYILLIRDDNKNEITQLLLPLLIEQFPEVLPKIKTLNDYEWVQSVLIKFFDKDCIANVAKNLSCLKPCFEKLFIHVMKLIDKTINNAAEKESAISKVLNKLSFYSTAQKQIWLANAYQELGHTVLAIKAYLGIIAKKLPSCHPNFDQEEQALIKIASGKIAEMILSDNKQAISEVCERNNQVFKAKFDDFLPRIHPGNQANFKKALLAFEFVCDDASPSAITHQYSVVIALKHKQKDCLSVDAFEMLQTYYANNREVLASPLFQVLQRELFIHQQKIIDELKIMLESLKAANPLKRSSSQPTLFKPG